MSYTCYVHKSRMRAGLRASDGERSRGRTANGNVSRSVSTRLHRDWPVSEKSLFYSFSLLFPYVINNRLIGWFGGIYFRDAVSLTFEKEGETPICGRVAKSVQVVGPCRGSRTLLINNRFIYHARWRRAIMVACATTVSILLTCSIEGEFEGRNMERDCKKVFWLYRIFIEKSRNTCSQRRYGDCGLLVL